jgi:hypothetical protein
MLGMISCQRPNNGKHTKMLRCLMATTPQAARSEGISVYRPPAPKKHREEATR